MERPSNLYDLCDQVCESIAARPQNYMQQRWAATEPKRTLEVECGSDTAARLIAKHEMCGTAYCRAGWMLSILRDGPVNEQHNISNTVMNLLHKAGVPPSDTDKLFNGSQAGPLSTWGTPGYVQKGITGVREFMAKHEQTLKNAQLVYGANPGEVDVQVMPVGGLAKRSTHE